MPHRFDDSVLLSGLADDGTDIQTQFDLARHVSEILTPQLDDPLLPRCCFLCCSVVSGLFESRDCGDVASHLLASNHGFFDRCMSVLAAPRTSADLLSMRAMLEENSALCITPHLHIYVAPQRVGDALATFMTALVTWVSESFWAAKSGKFFRTHARDGCWPTIPQQIFPYGAHASVSSYVFWCDTLLCPFMMPLLAFFLRVARADLFRALLDPPQKDVLMLALVATLQGAGADRTTHWALSQSLPGMAAPPADIALSTQHAAALLLNAVYHAPDSRHGDLDLLVAGHERPLYSVLLSALADIPHDNLRYSMCLLVSHLHRKLSLPPSAAQSAVDDVIHETAATMNVPPPHDFVSGLVFDILLHQQHQTESKTCATAGCRDPAFQICARCRLARYCGRACQREQWKGAQDDAFALAHRGVCPILSRLKNAGLSPTLGTPEERLRLVSEILRQAPLLRTELHELFQWAVMLAII